MKVVLIGTGNVASVLGRLLVQSGHTIVQVYGRNRDKAAALAKQLNTSYIISLTSLASTADIYLVAVTDDAIPEIVNKLSVRNQLLVHTAGSVSKEVLRDISKEYGVLYPLQSLRSATPTQPRIPFLIDAVSAKGIQQLKDLADSIGSGFQVCGDQQRLQMHLAAVWVNNFPNLLHAIAYRICAEKGLNFSLLEPLIRQTAERIENKDPWSWQTGPAIRNDKKTIYVHEEILQQHPEWLRLYQELTNQIQAFNNNYSNG